MRRVLRRKAIRSACAALFLLCAASSPAAHSMADRGDARWASRAERLVDGRPEIAAIADAIGSYERDLARDPARLEVRWKLLRALYFAGYFAERDRERALARFDRARAVSDAGVAQLAAGGRAPHERTRVGPGTAIPAASERAEVAAFYFWAAINWGAWAEARGLVAAVREGVANRLRDYALVTVALYPELEAGGAHRLLARLHAKLPAVPVVSGWVDRTEAIPEAERALALAPDEPGNRLLLALTILDVGADRRDEALAILGEIARLEPRAESIVEDLAMRRSAAERLAVERRGEGRDE